MKWTIQRRIHSVLGLNLIDGELRVVHAVRGKEKPTVLKTTSCPLQLSSENSSPEEIGGEIKKHLLAADIRETHCVVAVPAAWTLSQQSKLPELSQADLNSFLELEAEKGFPCDTAQLQIDRSFCQGNSAKYVTQFAVRKEQIELLTAILRQAGLKPLSCTIGLVALPEVIRPVGEGRITVAVSETGAAVLISVGGGIAAYRSIEMTTVSPKKEMGLNREAVARELRITLEQVAPELRADLRELQLCGDAAIVHPLAESLARWSQAEGLAVTFTEQVDLPLHDQIAAMVATRWLETGSALTEFLPPRPDRWTSFRSRFNARRMAHVAAAAGVALALVSGAYSWQEIRLWSLRSEWQAMKTQVTDLESVQSLIRDYHPWYDTTFHSLSILRRVTESFPDNGSVTAKSFEIHGLSNVSVTGTARDNTSLLKTVDQLRKTREIQGLKIEQIHGKAPLQFTLSFRWNKLAES